ncbi:MAG: hypothetical protein QOF04_1821 [Solirubrobacteraceae bacterium]|nr:hypothetical protein [Solirubrobacteraceae bacterium]
MEGLARGGDMAREMREQPEAVRRTLLHARDRLAVLRARLGAADLVLLLGRGSSRAAAMYGAHALQAVAGVPAFALSPTTLGRRGAPLPLDRALVVCVSQSGESRELVEAAERVPSERLLVVTNAPDSTLAGLADEAAVLDCAAGPERAVPATKTLTTSLAWLFALAAAEAPGLFADAAVALPELLHAAVSQPAPELVSPGCSGLVVAGEGLGEAVALEGSIKLAETLCVPAATFETSDLFHGSVNMAGPGVGVIAVGLDLDGRRLAGRALDAAAARGATTAYVGIDPAPWASRRATLPPLDPALLAIAAVPHLQVAAHAAALAAGLDPDRPSGLSKVTDIGAPDRNAA